MTALALARSRLPPATQAIRAPICHVIGARSRGCPITGVRLEFFVIGYPRDFHVNYVRLNGFLRSVSHSFQNL